MADEQDKPLTFEQLKAFAAKLHGNGLPAGTPVQTMFGGVPYETCDICTRERGHHILHPVGIPHEECV